MKTSEVQVGWMAVLVIVIVAGHVLTPWTPLWALVTGYALGICRGPVRAWLAKATP